VGKVREDEAPQAIAIEVYVSILFCTPCYGSMTHAQHFESCLNLKEELTKLGLPHDWLVGKKESLVHRARMEMCATYLQRTNWARMMWLDADLEFTPDDVAKVWNLDADVGVGVYAMKKEGEDWYAAWTDGKLVKDLDQFDGPTEVDYAGTGFMMIKREAVERVYEHLKKLHAECEALLDKLDGLSIREHQLVDLLLERVAPDYEGPHGRVPALYMTPVHNDGLESEDYHFSRMARDAGLKVIMDPSVRLIHWGQYGYGSSKHH
jgi:hypothetical protein